MVSVNARHAAMLHAAVFGDQQQQGYEAVVASHTSTLVTLFSILTKYRNYTVSIKPFSTLLNKDMPSNSTITIKTKLYANDAN